MGAVTGKSNLAHRPDSAVGSTELLGKTLPHLPLPCSTHADRQLLRRSASPPNRPSLRLPPTSPRPGATSSRFLTPKPLLPSRRAPITPKPAPSSPAPPSPLNLSVSHCRTHHYTASPPRRHTPPSCTTWPDRTLHPLPAQRPITATQPNPHPRQALPSPTGAHPNRPPRRRQRPPRPLLPYFFLNEPLSLQPLLPNGLRMSRRAAQARCLHSQVH